MKYPDGKPLIPSIGEIVFNIQLRIGLENTQPYGLEYTRSNLQAIESERAGHRHWEYPRVDNVSITNETRRKKYSHGLTYLQVVPEEHAVQPVQSWPPH